MAHPKGGYRNAANKRAPGTTTVIGRFKDSGGLLWWAFDQGKAAERGEIISLYDKRDEAANIGTAAHAMVEAHINGESPDDARDGFDLGDDNAEKADNAYGMYLKWERQTKIEIISKYQEISLFSEEYQFGGTPDAIGRIDGELVLLDWKTSKGVYQDFLIQLSAYKHLWEVNNPDKPITGGFYLCRFAKDFPDFAAHFYGELDEAWEQFKLFRRAYEIDKILKKRAA